MDLESRLKRLGYEVSGAAASGEEAVVKALHLKPDIILMDILLKGEMDGIEAARRIIQEIDIPIVFVTAFSDDSTIQRAKAANPFGYVLKPVDERELNAAIQVGLAKHATERKLKKVEQWLTTILKSIADPLLTTGVDGLVTYMNPAAEALTGWDWSEASGRPAPEIYRLVNTRDGSDVENPIQQVLREGMVVAHPGQATLIARNGAAFPVDYTLSLTRGTDGRITGTVAIIRDISHRVQSEQALQELALRDPLTELFNRRAILEQGEYEWARALRYDKPFCVLLVDADNFKSINDRFGHAEGDRALKHLGGQILKCLRRADYLGRFGGEEFLVILPETKLNGAAAVAQHILRDLNSTPIAVGGRSQVVTCSIGAAMQTPDDHNLGALILRADKALYAAKHQGKNCVVSDPPVAAA